MREHLIAVIPGIGGSILAPPGKPESPVWSLTRGDLALIRHPERLSLAESPLLHPIGLITSARPLPFWTAVPGYEGLLRRLGAPHPTVLAVPYDFRLSVAAAAEHSDTMVRQRLQQLWPDADHHGKVIVVAHSMGGLVARYWLGPLGGAACCRALITLGTPHWGAPKALDVLANGIPVPGGHILTRLRDVLRQWPSMAELLPRYRAVLETGAGTASGSGVLRYPHDLPLPRGIDAQAAYQLHQRIETAWETLPRSATAVVPRIGYGHATPRACTWDGTRVSVTKDRPAWPDLGRWDDDLGDGTVPAYSGLPVEMDQQPPDGFLVRCRHGQLGGLDEVAALVAQYEGRGSLRPVRGVERPAVLGLDLDAVQVEHEPSEITAAIHAPDQPGRPARPRGGVWAVVRRAGCSARAVAEVELTPGTAPGRFHGQLPALTAGTHQVTVSARDVPGIGDLESRDLVSVLAHTDLD
jgi:hypothetical protein